MRLQRNSYAPKSCAFDAANVQFLRAHLCKTTPSSNRPIAARGSRGFTTPFSTKMSPAVD